MDCSPQAPLSMDLPRQEYWSGQQFPLLLLLLSRFSCVRLCATPETASHQAPQSMGFSRQEYWNGVPLPSPAISFTRGYSWSRDWTPIAYITDGFFTSWATRDIYLSRWGTFQKVDFWWEFSSAVCLFSHKRGLLYLETVVLSGYKGKETCFPSMFHRKVKKSDRFSLSFDKLIL